MSASDASNLAEVLVSTRLEPHEMLLYDEGLSDLHRFRPYDIATLDRLAEWAAPPSRPPRPSAST